MKDQNIDLIKTFNLAIEEHQLGNHYEAKKLYKKILNLDANHFESTFYLGTLCAQENNLNEETEVALPPQEEETNDVELPAPPENESVIEETAEASENVEQEITEEELQQKKTRTFWRVSTV